MNACRNGQSASRLHYKAISTSRRLRTSADAVPYVCRRGSVRLQMRFRTSADAVPYVVQRSIGSADAGLRMLCTSAHAQHGLFSVHLLIWSGWEDVRAPRRRVCERYLRKRSMFDNLNQSLSERGREREGERERERRGRERVPGRTACTTVVLVVGRHSSTCKQTTLHYNCLVLFIIDWPTCASLRSSGIWIDWWNTIWKNSIRRDLLRRSYNTQIDSRGASLMWYIQRRKVVCLHATHIGIYI